MIGEFLFAFILFISILAISIYISNKKPNKNDYKQQVLDYIEASDKIIATSDSKSIDTIKESIACLDSEYSKVQAIMGQSGRDLYSEDRTILTDQLHDLEQERWERKANKYLQEFVDCYYTLVNGEFDNFRDVEKLFQTKKRCIDLWQKYFAIDLSDYETTIYPKRYLREWMDDDYDPCMESHDALEKKLSSLVDNMRPEHKRKKALYNIIVNHVIKLGTISRADLLNTKFDGFIADEVKCCYKELIKTNRLVEVKLGGRYFVSLSDKESAKRSRQSTKKVKENTECNCKSQHDAIIDYLKDAKVEYIDMSQKGGAIYFFSDVIASDLRSRGYTIIYAKNGSKSTSGRPAWYYKQY